MSTKNLKTLNDFLEAGIELYPRDVDENTKALIADWFGYRKVCHNALFPVMFNRVLERDYPRYMELLRIEARTAGSEYDWLVTNYEERQTTHGGTDVSTNNSINSGNVTNATTFTAGQSTSTTENGNESATHNGTLNETGTQTTTRTDDLRHNTSVNGAVNGTSNTTSSHTPNLVNVTDTSANETNRHGALTRQAPYDADYSGLTSDTNKNRLHVVGDSGVDVGVTGITNDSEYNAGFPNLVITNPTTAADELSDNSSVNHVRATTSGSELTSTQVSTGDNKTETTLTTDTGTVTDALSRNLQHTNVDTNEATSHNVTNVTHSGSDTTQTTTTNNLSNTATNRTQYGKVERTIYTGRSGQSPQYLLNDAVSFIKSTSAWAWLYSKIDSCFMLVYDLDRYENI